MVLSPDDTHHDVAVAALRAGVPVFCEKPLATTIADCDDVLADGVPRPGPGCTSATTCATCRSYASCGT